MDCSESILILLCEIFQNIHVNFWKVDWHFFFYYFVLQHLYKRTYSKGWEPERPVWKIYMTSLIRKKICMETGYSSHSCNEFQNFFAIEKSFKILQEIYIEIITRFYHNENIIYRNRSFNKCHINRESRSRNKMTIAKTDKWLVNIVLLSLNNWILQMDLILN